MLVRARFRRRADDGEPIDSKHARVIEALRAMAPPWGVASSARIELDRGETGASADLTPGLVEGLGGALHWIATPPADTRGVSASDDVLVLEVETEAVDYEGFVLEAFPEYVRAFEAYRGSVIVDEMLDLDDGEKVIEACEQTGKDVDGRDGVFRIAAVNFFDEELCRRAFGVRPAGMIQRVQGRAERVSDLRDGVLLIVSSSILARSVLEGIDGRIRSLLSSGTDPGRSAP